MPKASTVEIAPTPATQSIAEEVENNELSEEDLSIAETKAKIEKDYTNKKGEYVSIRKGGFLGVLKGKIKSVVKSIQSKENEIQQKDKFIQGDAAINNYFMSNLIRLENSDLGESGDNSADSQNNELTLKKFASKVFKGSFKKSLLPNGYHGPFKRNIISDAAKSSLENAKKSKKNVDETTGDRVIVEMYYNQISKIKEETKGKDNEQKKEAIDIYAFSKVRSNKVAERKKQQIAMYKDLEGKGRVSTTFERVRSATGNAIGSAALKLVTFGLAKTKKHQDKRGFLSNVDFNLDLDTGSATMEKISSGSLLSNIDGPCSQINKIGAELNAKRAARKGNGMFSFFSTTAFVIDAFKKLAGIAKSFFSMSSLYLALLTTICPPIAVVSAILGTIAYYIGLAMNGMTVLKLLFSSLAQAMNDNPALFLELQGETIQSGLNVLEEGATVGSSIGFNSLRSDLTGQAARADLEGRYNINKTFENNRSIDAGEGAAELGSQKWWDDKGLLTADIAAGTVTPSVANVVAGISTQSTDKLDVTYNQDMKEHNRIGNNSGQASSTPAELKLIKKSYLATKEKAKKQSSKVSKLVSKTTKKEIIETNDNNLTAENQQKTKKIDRALNTYQNSGAKLITDLKNPLLER